MLEVLFNNGAAWFTVPALTATAIFVMQLVLMLVGADDGGLDLDIDVGAQAHHSTFVFHILSFQAIAVFVMGFGWGAFASYRGMGWDYFTSVILGAVCGGALVWLLYLLLKALHDLQSSGNIPLHATVGREGQVYTGIPEGGAGQVRLVVGNRDRTYTARSAAGAIERGQRVRVVSVNPDNTVTVDRA
jgi:membrane protein implicated in regulation of membrane protease activity